MARMPVRPRRLLLCLGCALLGWVALTLVGSTPSLCWRGGSSHVHSVQQTAATQSWMASRAGQEQCASALLTATALLSANAGLSALGLSNDRPSEAANSAAECCGRYESNREHYSQNHHCRVHRPSQSEEEFCVETGIAGQGRCLLSHPIEKDQPWNQRDSAESVDQTDPCRHRAQR